MRFAVWLSMPTSAWVKNRLGFFLTIYCSCLDLPMRIAVEEFGSSRLGKITNEGGAADGNPNPAREPSLRKERNRAAARLAIGRLA